MVLKPVACIHCGETEEIKKRGKTEQGKQRYSCPNKDCEVGSFILDYSDRGRLRKTKEQIVDMCVNGSGIRDTARVLKVSINTVIDVIKKRPELTQVNEQLIQSLDISEVEVKIEKVIEEAEMDEMWSFVGKKEDQRWLWHAIDHQTGEVLAYVFGRRKDEVFLKLKELLEPFGIKRFYTDDWGAYTRHLDNEKLQIGKRNTQKIERKHLTLRTRIKRLARKTICFSKS